MTLPATAINPSRPKPLTRALASIVALACAAAGLWLAAHHPLSSSAAMALFGLVAAAVAAWPSLWLLALPAAAMTVGLAPWTGWISVEETDLMVLAVAAGGYARWARWAASPGTPGRGRQDSSGSNLLAWCLILGWTLSVLIATQRGVTDAGGWAPDWWQAYRGPMNALRLAKPTLGLLLLLPLWRHLLSTPVALATGKPAADALTVDGQMADRLTLGLALAHAGVAGACLWERLAYTGLLNFSSDYRTTALFWEMHVGGAALDGFLALTLPFALRLWWTARSRIAWAGAALMVLLGIYALLTTFSRILLVAPPLGVALMLWVQWRSAAPGVGHAAAAPAASAGAHDAPAHPAAGLLLCVGVIAAAAWMFPSSGYRGMLALLGNAALLLMLGPQVRALRRADWGVALVLAATVGPALITLALQWPKGPYWVFGAVVLACTAALWRARGRGPLLAAAVAAYAVALAMTPVVAAYWGGPAALPRALAGVLGLALALLACAVWPQAPWPARLRWQGGALLSMALAGVVVGMFSGGAYMSDRLSSSGDSERGRWQHWRSTMWRVRDAESAWLGVGLGRFLDHFALEAGPGQRPGDIRLADVAGVPVMRMVAGTHVQGWGELLRLSQHIERPTAGANPKVLVTLRNADAALVHVEICLKHLLYDANCQIAELSAKPSGEAWQTLSIPLLGKPLPPDAAGLPRFTVFSLATESSKHPIDVREVVVKDAKGTNLIRNGRFEQGGARWFFSSDRNHMPWHAKNMAVHVLFEQGYLGLAALLLMTLVALGRVVLGRARHHPLAPALAGGLLGFCGVGAIDSLLDMPRVAGLFLLLLGIALTLKPPEGQRSRVVL